MGFSVTSKVERRFERVEANALHLRSEATAAG
jgi:hypothetical protein